MEISDAPYRQLGLFTCPSMSDPTPDKSPLSELAFLASGVLGHLPLSPAASAASRRTISTNNFSIAQLPLFSLGSILSHYPTLRLCSQFRQEFVDLTTRKSGLITDSSQGHHHRPRTQWQIQVALKYALLNTPSQQCRQMVVPSAKRKNYSNGILKNAAGCFDATFLALRTGIPFRPSRPWRRWLGRWKFLSISCSMTARSRLCLQTVPIAGLLPILPGVGPARMAAT